MNSCSLKLMGRHDPELCSITVAPCEVEMTEECEIFEDEMAKEIEDADAD